MHQQSTRTGAFGGERASPTYAQRQGLASTLARNIRSLEARRRAEAARLGYGDRIAGAITRFTGSMPFVYLHIALFAGWIAANLGWLPFVPPWDPTFVVLGTLASCEAIFLSTFVLISQNRMVAAAEKRADLDLQINLLSEHEVTKLVQLVTRIADRVGVEPDRDPELAEIRQNVAPETVLDEIEASAGSSARR